MKTTGLVGVAGMCGALLRVGIGQWIGEEGGFPIATLLTNYLATFLLMLCSSYTFSRYVRSKSFGQAVTIGFLGAFSTFSAFSIETLLLLEAGHSVIALLYVFASIFGGLIIAALATKVSEKWVKA